MDAIFVIATWAICGWLCHQIAQSKRRNKEMWAILGVLFGFAAVLIVAVMPTLAG